MRKVFLSVFVIISFILYAVTIRIRGAEQTQAITSNIIGKRIIVTPTVIPTAAIAPLTPTPINNIVRPTTLILKPTATPQPIAPTATPKPSSPYKDGIFTGSVADAFYGPIQVQVTISGGKITNVQFLQAPNDRGTSIMINQQADPMLAQEAIQAQSANVDIVSGATDTSNAFVQSMQTALLQAKS